MDLPRPITVREISHRLLNPFSDDKLATLAEAISPAPGTSILDLACGKGELLSTWARDYGVTGTGVDISTIFLDAARERATELGIADQVDFVHGDASDYVSAEPVGIASCVGATWIGGGVAGTVDLLRRSLAPGGVMLIGEPYWRLDPPDQATIEACHVSSRDDLLHLPELLEQFLSLGCDVVEMVLADQESWDRYTAAQWMNQRRWLDANPDHELHEGIRASLDTEPVKYARYRRKYNGWGVFVLMDR